MRTSGFTYSTSRNSIQWRSAFRSRLSQNDLSISTRHKMLLILANASEKEKEDTAKTLVNLMDQYSEEDILHYIQGFRSYPSVRQLKMCEA